MTRADKESVDVKGRENGSRQREWSRSKEERSDWTREKWNEIKIKGGRTCFTFMNEYVTNNYYLLLIDSLVK